MLGPPLGERGWEIIEREGGVDFELNINDNIHIAHTCEYQDVG
jgi:hypothetical protein